MPPDAPAEFGPSQIGTQCLVRAPRSAIVDVHLRFLHLSTRHDGDGTWDEASERTVTVHISVGERGVVESFRWPGLRHADRSQEDLRGDVEVHVEPIGGLDEVYRLTVIICNTTPLRGGSTDRALAMRHALVSTHVFFESSAGAFVSLVDPPENVADAAAGCRQCGLWPVLVGDSGWLHAMLAAPIMLADYPRVVPESPADFFDRSEIDEMLVLRILTLTDDEKAHMRRGDTRARRLLERAERLRGDEMLRLHATDLLHR
jgi:hypothetical protein